ncbi:DegT/DnrJ/EryC1/StrS family aminotransferase [Parablautia muri]|uniref:DegT/DnrJ/EryC1/StrS family aminotransferase n=1 Tax=Parablautia muri TaxID=2320879 RepID=A0A9X5BCV3_9FIRM|nr:DegT/DnrJ/EryC1/StrS family aminotransferase [Parablautia muri]NBJ91342.1 DegT/DnrJ/EryC1/StrS family aminotransferase [Parablautia muri]
MDEQILVTKTSLPPYEDYIKKIRPLWDSHWITNMGMNHKLLEEKLCAYLQAPYLSLTVNGHMALELAIQAMDFPEGSEVITTPFTFISTTHAIVRNRLTPVFCDIKLDDYTIDETKIEELITKKTVAILPVHVYGNLCNVEAIARIASKYNLKVIYDSAHAFGETLNGKGIAHYGDVSIFSFHATKVFNTIEGGAVALHSKEMLERLYNLKNFGIRGEELIVSVGANAKMNEFSAIMGLCNLEYISENIELRRQKVQIYAEELANMDSIVVQKYNQEGVTYNYGYFPIRFLKKDIRDLVYNKLREQNIYSRKYFFPLTSDANCFEGKYNNLQLTNAKTAANNVLVLPLYPELNNSIIIKICKLIKEFSIL